MKLSVFYNHITEAARQRKMSVEEVLRMVRTMDIEAVELDLADLFENFDFIEKLLAGTRTSVSSVYYFYHFLERDDEYKKHVELAKKIGSRRIMLVPDLDSTQAAYGKILEGMKRACAYAAENDLLPLIEDFDDENSPVSTMEKMYRFLEEIPELRVALDTGNFIYSGEDELAAFSLFRKKIAHVHCKDRSIIETRGEKKISITGTDLYPSPVGKGIIKMREIVASLLGGSYHGYFTIEHFGAANQLEYMNQSVRWLKNVERSLRG